MRIKKKPEQNKQTKNIVWEKEEGKLNAVIPYVNGVYVAF